MNVFFYGLFMDEDMLRSMGANPRHVGVAAVDGYRLAIAARATLVAEPGATVEGVVTELDEAGVATLYAGPTLADYRPIPVVARLRDDRSIEAVSYILPESEALGPRNEEYAAKLRALAGRLGLSGEYLATI